MGFVTCGDALGNTQPAALFCHTVPVVTPSPAGAPPVVAPAPIPKALPGRGLSRGDGSVLDSILVEADALMANGDFEAAEKKYRAAMLKAPKDPAPMVGHVRARLGRAKIGSEYGAAPKSALVKAAIRDLQTAQKHASDYGPLHLELGRCWLLLAEPKEADAALEESIRLDPSDPEAHSSRGVALVALGKVEAAIQPLTHAAEIDPGSAERQGNLGTALLFLGRVDEAVSAYQRARRISPGDARIANDLGTSLLQQGQIVEAIAALEQAVQLKPERASFHNNLGYAYYLKGDLGAADQRFAKATELDNKLIAAWVNRANVAARQHRLDSARSFFEKARALDPADPRVQALEAELKDVTPR